LDFIQRRFSMFDEEGYMCFFLSVPPKSFDDRVESLEIGEAFKFPQHYSMLWATICDMPKRPQLLHDG
jgi:hypothetical protein